MITVSLYKTYLIIGQWKSESVSRSVVPDSLQPHVLQPARLSVHGILQARILGRVAIPFSRGSSWSRDWTQVSYCRQILQGLSHQGSPLRVRLCSKSTLHIQYDAFDSKMHCYSFTTKEERTPACKSVIQLNLMKSIIVYISISKKLNQEGERCFIKWKKYNFIYWMLLTILWGRPYYHYIFHIWTLRHRKVT